MPYKGDTYKPCWKIKGSDLWNFDKTMTGFLADGLERYLASESGYPGDRSLDEWKAELQAAAAAFRRYYEDDLDAAWRFLKHNFQALWT